jgi:hypothetical protein
VKAAHGRGPPERRNRRPRGEAPTSKTSRNANAVANNQPQRHPQGFWARVHVEHRRLDLRDAIQEIIELSAQLASVADLIAGVAYEPLNLLHEEEES